LSLLFVPLFPFPDPGFLYPCVPELVVGTELVVAVDTSSASLVAWRIVASLVAGVLVVASIVAASLVAWLVVGPNAPEQNGHHSHNLHCSQQDTLGCAALLVLGVRVGRIGRIGRIGVLVLSSIRGWDRIGRLTSPPSTRLRRERDRIFYETHRPIPLLHSESRNRELMDQQTPE